MTNFKQHVVKLGITVNAHYYKSVLQKVKKVVKKKRGSDHHWFLHHDNAPPSHYSLAVQQYLTKKAMTTIPYPPYSSDLSPCDFFLFPQFKWTMKGKWFLTTEAIRLETDRELCKITPADFQPCNTQWLEHWRRCVSAGGKYFEGDR